ncbi:peptide chain release factor 2 [Eikenella sp. NML96-A-049]|uniref:peptide chain release factor 2 n=1 Tax=unclassified Eikenella TaxID=2639367 RepID=UPI0007DE9FCE|nr:MULTISPECIES: peptide chain release factor 2 [unclassified Eikenella]OAM35389.1 peptide chain release factor 2 [Eikenella sp. NML070372]OAM40761.1 peptide chain release factor 2 [Eikenella sp. NML96-A-049]VDH01709.1 peptide chain release factor 2 [Helicobacter pametensis]
MEAERINLLNNTLADLEKRSVEIRVYLDYDGKKDRLEEVVGLSEDPELWNDPKRAQEIGKERKVLEGIVLTLDNIAGGIDDNRLLIDMALEEGDEDSFAAIEEDVAELEKQMAELEFKRMFNQPADVNNCFIDITAGAGGTEAEDWAGMLLRMYVRYGERKGFKVEIMEQDDGEIAGINRATIRLEGEYAYGLLRTETGVHRLVRHSPFDSNNKRHTSFASVFVYPEVDDSFEVEINPADVRTDTFRASGAGGQHINKTDSAVRMTHIPTGIVVQSQNSRSQHDNRRVCEEMLRAKLFELEMRKRNEEKQALEEGKSDVGWGSQIRSYVLDSSRIKDLRTSYETGNTKAVLDGDLDDFIETSLKQGM